MKVTYNTTCYCTIKCFLFVYCLPFNIKSIDQRVAIYFDSKASRHRMKRFGRLLIFFSFLVPLYQMCVLVKLKLADQLATFHSFFLFLPGTNSCGYTGQIPVEFLNRTGWALVMYHFISESVTYLLEYRIGFVTLRL